jgi:DNA-binding MarR family transcriptional regulator
MSEIFGSMAGLDKLIHEPARLAIMTALSACRSADFTFLQHLTGLTQGNLSGHLTKLEEAGFLQLDKQFVGKRPNTTISLTDEGRKAIEQHWQQLQNLHDNAQHWKPEE